MKTLIVSTNDLAGGAAIAAFRLHRGLLEVGVESRMLVQTKTSDDLAVTEIAKSPNGERWLPNLGDYLGQKARRGTSNTAFSLAGAHDQLTGHPLLEWAEVINLHWVAGFVSPAILRDVLRRGKPVVWTLHDQRPFTGGCHYTSGCELFRTDCGECPQLRPDFHRIPHLSLQLVMETLRDLPALTVVAPSRWLAEEARRSRLFGGLRVEVIPYGIDLDVFRPNPSQAARAKLDLPRDALVCLFGAYTLQEHRKGFDLLSQAIQSVLDDPDGARLHADGRLIFAAYGKDEKSLRKSGLPIRLLGHMESAGEMASTLSAADLVICPTREDNLPNVVMEAMACGVPVLSCRVGGVPDMVEDGVHGRLVPAEDANALGQALRELVLNPDPLKRWGAAGRSKCELEYPLRLQGQRYQQLFSSLSTSTSPLCPHESSRLLEAEKQLSATLLEAQQSQTQELLEECKQLREQLRHAQAKAAASPGSKAALKFVEAELQKRRHSGWPATLSPTFWALRMVRKLLKRV